MKKKDHSVEEPAVKAEEDLLKKILSTLYRTFSGNDQINEIKYAFKIS